MTSTQNLVSKEENKDIKDTILNLQSFINSSKCSESISNGCIMMEYKYLQKFSPSGIYIIPQYNNIRIWNGAVFVREGPYFGGVFKFEIKFPQNYPSKIPEINFLTPLIHPYVNISNGKLDLTKNFNNWDAGKNYIIQLVYFIQNIFIDESILTDENSYNPSIAILAKNSFDEYVNKVSKMLEENKLIRFNKTESASVNFSQPKEQHKMILKKILEQDQEIDLVDRVEEFKNWFMNNFSEQIIKKS